MSDNPMFAMVSAQGTAMSETSLCGGCRRNPDAIWQAVSAFYLAPDHGEVGWHDCTGNTELVCIICGRTTYGEVSLS